MKNKAGIYGIRFIRWFFIIGILLAIFLWFILFIIATFFTEDLKQNDKIRQATNEEMKDEQSATLSEQYPQVVEFVNNYFDQIQRGNYSELKENYWDENVVDQIQKSCASPIEVGELQEVEKMWRKCGFFNGINIEIIDIDEKINAYHVTVQFFDDDQEVIGLQLHPEWSRGHQLVVVPGVEGLTTLNWEFFK